MRPTEEWLGIILVEVLQDICAILDNVILVIKLMPRKCSISIQLSNFCLEFLVTFAEWLVLFIHGDTFTKLGDGHHPHFAFVLFVTCFFDLCKFGAQFTFCNCLLILFFFILRSFLWFWFFLRRFLNFLWGSNRRRDLCWRWCHFNGLVLFYFRNLITIDILYSFLDSVKALRCLLIVILQFFDR